MADEDAISRSEAIRVASGYCHWTNIPAELAKLPSVSTEKTGRWIPVSDRLPELLEDVLICDSSGCINIGFCAKRKYASGIEYTAWVEVGSDWDATPIAWMPLPKPYTGAKMEEKTETCKDCMNKCIMYEPNMKGCKDKMVEPQESEDCN